MMIYAVPDQVPCTYEVLRNSAAGTSRDYVLIIRGFDEATQRPAERRYAAIPGCVTKEQRIAWLERNVPTINAAMLLGMPFTGLNASVSTRATVQQFTSFNEMMQYVLSCMAGTGEAIATQKLRMAEFDNMVMPYFIGKKLHTKALTEISAADFSDLPAFVRERRHNIATLRSTISRLNILFRQAAALVDGWNAMPTFLSSFGDEAEGIPYEPAKTTPPVSDTDAAAIHEYLLGNNQHGMYVAVLLMESAMCSEDEIRDILVQDIDPENRTVSIRSIGKEITVPDALIDFLMQYGLSRAKPDKYLIGAQMKLFSRKQLPPKTMPMAHGKMVQNAGAGGNGYAITSWRLRAIAQEVKRGHSEGQIVNKFGRYDIYYIKRLIAKHGFQAA